MEVGNNLHVTRCILGTICCHDQLYPYFRLRPGKKWLQLHRLELSREAAVLAQVQGLEAIYFVSVARFARWYSSMFSL